MMNQAIALWEKLSQLQYLLRRRPMGRRAGPTADTTRGQGRILAFLKLQDGIRTKDLSYLMDIRISSLNELLAKLEKSGYILREPSEEDKRIMLIRLTEKGRAAEQPEPEQADLFRCLSPEEQETFGSYLDRIIAALEAELDQADPQDYAENCRRRQEAFDRCFRGEHARDGHRGPGSGCHGGFQNGFGRHRRSDGPCR